MAFFTSEYSPLWLHLCLVVAGLVVLGAALWRKALPKPIPGIPYHTASAGRILGDLPDLFRSKQGFFGFIASRCDDLNSPVIQVFLKPLQRPLVVVRDSRESYDILNRRMRDFDQSDFFLDQFKAVWPDSTVTFHTNDKWRYNRRLTGEIMGPVFLREVAAPIIHKYGSQLVDLWREKMRLANGRPFDANDDASKAFNDVIWMSVFGTHEGTVKSQVDLLASIDKLSNNDAAVAAMPVAPLPPLFATFRYITESGYLSRESPLGRWHHMFALRVYPRLSHAWRLKNRVARDSTRKAWQKFSNATDRDLGQRVDSAVEFVISREIKQARRENLRTTAPSRYLEGELAMLVGAGYDTTAASMNWIFKYLTDYPDVQSRARESIRAALSNSWTERRDPTADELYGASIPYLDAVIEESLRHSSMLPALTRGAIHNTELLGYQIPKGTTVVLMLSPSHDSNGSKTKDIDNTLLADEKLRTESGVVYKAANERWNHDDLQAFNPDRYLKIDPATKKEEFDPLAAPMLTFGGGLRGCFGRKLANLNMRIMTALILWHFELMKIDPALGTFKAREANVIVPDNPLVLLRPAHQT